MGLGRATFTWNKTGGGTWSVAANWTPSGPPTSTDAALFNLNASYTTGLSATTTCGTLTVGTLSAGTITFNAAGHALNFGVARFLAASTGGTVNFSGGTFAQTGIANALDVEDVLNVGTGAFLGNLNSFQVGTLSNASINLSAATLLVNALVLGEPDNVIGASSH